MLLFNYGCCCYSESTLQFCASRRFCAEFKTVKSDPLHPSGRFSYPSGRSSIKQHRFGRHGYFVRTPISVQKLQTVQGYIRSDFSATRPDAIQCSKSKKISFAETYGKTAATVRMTCLHRPNNILDKARRGKELQLSRRQGYIVRTPVLIMEIACSRSATVRTVGQHYPGTAQFRIEYQHFWKAGCVVVDPESLSYCPDAT